MGGYVAVMAVKHTLLDRLAGSIDAGQQLSEKRSQGRLVTSFSALALELRAAPCHCRVPLFTLRCASAYWWGVVSGARPTSLPPLAPR